jgi:serine/threonine-protein kinase RsbT
VRRPAAPIRLLVHEEPDVSVARVRVRELARRERFSEGRAGALTTAVSEIAQNIVVHAGAGELSLTVIEERGRRGILVVARDPHPGIANVDEAMRDGYSTSGGLGLGLSSAKRLVDEFTLASAPGEGTTITMKKWRDAPDE